MKEDLWMKIVMEEDENGDGSINFEEFKDILYKLLNK